MNPETFGIDYYAGIVKGAVLDYYEWRLTEDGTSSLQTEYITEVFTDLSIDWINNQDKPWFLWLAYNAPHTPFHIPPAEMHSQGALPTYEANLDAKPYYMAAIEAMDYQIGRLLDNIPVDELENTIIIFIGDNGTPNQVAQLPYNRISSKGSLYQGGVNVPMFITGNGVNRMGEDNSIIGSTDLFSTIAELAGVNNKEIYDSKSFKHLLDNSAAHRDFQYAEKDYADNDLWSINNGEYKLIVNANGGEEMYDLPNDPYEANNLLNGNLTTIQEAAKVALETELAIIRNQCQYEINLNEIIIASETLSAIKNISFAGSIASSSETVFEAGDSIILKSGFSTGAGATFTAKIQDCVPSDNSVKIIPQYPLSNIRTNIAPSIQNPFNLVISQNPSFGNSKILFELTQDSPISINLFDQSGKLSSALLSSSNRSAGKHELLIDEELNDGLYYVVMQTPFERVTKKMIVIK